MQELGIEVSGKKILIAGHIGHLKGELLLQTMKEQYGDDIVLVTPEEAKAQGLKARDFANIPSFKIKATPIMEQPMILGNPGSGKDKRRKRREEERKAKKARKW